MRRAINFGSIFRRKDGQQLTHSNKAADQELLAQQFAKRHLTLKEGELQPLTEAAPAIDWAKMGGQITLPAATIDGLLEGRTRIRAEHLKALAPSPIGSEVPDATEYSVSLAAVIPQIQDLLQSADPETTQPPEFETPFTVLANEDSPRFAAARTDKHKPKSHDENASAVQLNTSFNSLPADSSSSHDLPQSQPQSPGIIDNGTQQTGTKEVQRKDRTPTKETANVGSEKSAPKPPSTPVTQFHLVVSTDKHPARLHNDGRPRQNKDDPAHRGVEQLQEIFMLGEPLDGRRVARLLRQFPGVTGALILLEGGAVLGGHLPDCLSHEAALQAPEVFARFIRFIVELEAGRKAQSTFVTVHSGTTISLVSSGQIVLLVSHENRKLPPGLPQRLIDTAEALSLIYGDACS